MKTILCTNPNCQATIEVPDEALQVICTSCETWHFISDTDQDESSPPPTPSDEYDYTPLPEESSPPLSDFTHEQESSPGLPTYPTTPKLRDQPTSGGIMPPLGQLITEDRQRFPLQQGTNTIGRKGTDIVLQDKTVSRRHCVVEVVKSNDGNTWDYFVYDIGYLDGVASTNGVLLSGRSLRLDTHERLRISNRMSIKIGKTKLTLKTV